MADDSSWTPKQDMSLLCRVCANQHDYLIPIFEGEGLDHDMPTKMDKHLPIKVRENDKLPTQMCYQCASTIIAWSELVTNCLEADKKLSRMLKINEKKAGTVALVDEDATSDHYEDAYDDVGGGDDYDDAAADDEDFEKEIKQLISDAGVELGSKTTKAKTTRATTRKRKSETVIVKKESKKSKTDTSVGKSSISLIKPKEEVTASDDRLPCMECCTRQCICKSNWNVECKICHIELNKKLLKNHLLTHHRDDLKPTSLDYILPCPQKNSDLKIEKRRGKRSKRKLFYCYYCNKGFINKSRLEEHVFQCKKKRKENLDKFRITWGEDMVRYQCPTCQIVLKRKDTLRHHLKLHTGEKFVTCEQCGKQLHGVYAFKRHLKSVHLKIKDLCCDLCGKAFSCQTNLAAHKKTHTGDKPYVCENCGKSFAQNASLKYHHDTVHALIKKRLFQCSQCPKKFYRNSKLNAHLKIHTEERAYFCDICNHSFKTDNEVKKHKRFVHTDARPHACQYCSATFKKSDHLKRHSKTAHKEMYQSEDVDQQTILLDPRSYVHPYIPYQSSLE